jgi:hypothetical protein
MKISVLPKLSMLALAGLLALSSCDKEDEAKPDENFVSAEDNARMESEMETSQNYVEADATERLGSGGQAAANAAFSACVTRTWDAATKTLTIDFGSTNCLCKDGLYRRGQIVAVFNGNWRTTGSSITITHNNYFVNDNQHIGTKIITSLGNESSTSGNYRYSVQVQNASILFTDGSVRSWNAQREVERTAGQGTPTILDDEYLVTGSSAGTNRRGTSFTTTIATPLKKVFRAGCARTFIAGTVNITNSKGKNLVLNYDPSGNEACDRTASVTFNGHTKIITLR